VKRVLAALTILSACAASTEELAGLDGAVSRDANSEPGDGALRTDAAAGADGAGLVSDASASCGTAAECSGARATVAFCDSAAWSCIQDQCVWECGGGGRVCGLVQPEPGACLRCEAVTSCPATNGCIPGSVVTTMVEAATCPFFPGTMLPFTQVGVTFEHEATDQCSYRGHLAHGGDDFGEVFQLDKGTWYAVIPGFGGVCTGVFASTNALRLIFSCPNCQFVLGW
jgi:hypothetical protein